MKYTGKKIFVQFITDLSFKIVHQTDTYNDFIGCEIGDEYEDKDKFFNGGFFLSSRAMPEVCTNGLFVRGRSSNRDDAILVAPDFKWKRKMLEAIRAYNREFT